jgi:hypothetical protein
MFVPLTETVAPAIGWLFKLLVTFPVIVFCCANKTLVNNNKRTPNNILNEVDLAIIIL